MVGFMIKNIRNLCFIIFILILASTLGFASASSDTAAIDSSGDNLNSIAIVDGDGAGLLEDSNVNLDNDVAADSKDNDDLTLLGNSDDGDSIYESGNDDSNLNQADFNYSLNSINEDINLKSQDVVYISPDGDEIGSGSMDDPTTWENAINLVGDNGTIVFLDGEYLLSNQFLDKNLTLKGLNSNAVISDTTFVVNSDNVLNIENLIFTDNEDYVVYSNGTVNVKDSTFANNSADVLIQSKNANIVSSNFTGNNGTSVSGGNITIDSSNFINNNKTPVSAIDGVLVKNSSFINNTGKESGAVYSVFNAEVYDSEFINNSALIGGAVNAVHNLTVENSNFEGNNASVGSAVLAKSSDIKDSNFTNNTAIQGVVSSADLNIDNCVFDNNTAVSKGVIYTENATVKNSKFNDNEAEDDITILALNELNEENNDINPDEIEVVQTTQMSWEFDDNQMLLENGDIAYCIQKSNPVPYGGVYLFESLDFVLSQITGEDVSQYLKILISQNLENEDYGAIQEAIWIFTDGDYKNSDNEIVNNVLSAYDDGVRINTNNAKVALSNGTWVSLNFKATTRADAQNLLAYNVSELGVPNMTVAKKSLNPITDLREFAWFEIEVANTGDVDLSDIVVNESYSSYLKFVSWESISGDWSSSNNRSFLLSKLDVGERASFKICFNATYYGNLTNTVNANSAETDIVSASNNTFVPRYDLTINKRPSKIDNIVNDIIYYNITARNSGTGILHDIVVTDILPDSEVLQYLGVFDSSSSLSSIEITESNATFHFDGELGAGEAFYVVLMFKALKNETGIVNNASVVSDKVNRTVTTTVNVYNPVDLSINKTAYVWYDCPDYGIPYYGTSSVVNYMVVNFTVAVKNTGNKTLETVVVEDYGFDTQLLSSYSSCPEIRGYIYRNGRNETNGQRTGNFNYTLNNLAPGETAYVNFLFLVYVNQTGNFVVMNNSAYAYCPQEELNKSATGTFVLSNPAMYTINKTAQEWLDCPNYGIPYHGISSSVNYMAYNFTVTVKNTGGTTLESLVVGDYGLNSMLIYSCPDINGYVYRNGRNESNGQRTGAYNYTLYNLAPGETAYVKFIFLIYTDRSESKGMLYNYAYAYYPKQGINKTNSTQFTIYTYTINKTAKVLYDPNLRNPYGVGAMETKWMAVNFTAEVKNTGPSTIPSLIVSDYGFNQQLLYSYSACPEIRGYVYRNGHNESNGRRTGSFNYTLTNLGPGETAYVDFFFLVFYNGTDNGTTFMENSVCAYEPTNNLNKSYTDVFALYKNASYTINKTAKVLDNYTNYGAGSFKSNLFAVNFTVTVKNTGQNIIERITVGDYGFDQQYVSSSYGCPEISGYIYRNGANVSANGIRGNFNYTLFDIAPGETAYVDFLFLLRTNKPGSEIVMSNSAYARYYSQVVNTTGTYTISTGSNLLIDKNATVIYNYTLSNYAPYFAVNYTVTVENIGNTTIPYIDVEDLGFDSSIVFNIPPTISGYVYRNGQFVPSGTRTGNYMYTLSTLYPGEKAYINYTFYVYYNQSGSKLFMDNSAMAILPTKNVTVNKTFELLQPMYYTVNKTAVSLTNLTSYGANTLGHDYFVVNFTVAVNNTGQGTIDNLTVTDLGSLIPSAYGVPEITAYVLRYGANQTIGQRIGAYDYRLDDLRPGEVAYVNYMFLIDYNQTSNIVMLSNTAYAYNTAVENNQSVTEDFILEGPSLLSYKTANATGNYTVFDIYVLNLGNDTITDVIINDTYVTGIYERYSEEEGSSQLYGYINLGPVGVTELENAVFSIEKLDPFSGTVIHLYFLNNETGRFKNQVNVTGRNSTGDEINTSCEVNYTVSSIPTNISIAKETVTPTVHLGEQAAFDIIVSNDGDNVEELDVVDRLFNGMIFDHADPLPDGVSLTVVGGIPRFNVTLNPHSSLSFRVYFNTTRTGNLTNMVFTNASSTTNYVINASNKTEVLPPEYALDANKTALNKTILTNETTQAEFNITVSNTGLETLKNIAVSESQFDGLEYVSFDPSRSVGDWSVELIDGKPVFKLASLGSGDSASLIVIFNATEEGNLTNIAVVDADNVNQETVNATVEVIDANMTFGEIYNLSAVKTALNKTVDRNVSNETEFNITVSNTGNRVLANVIIEESMFKGLKFVSFDEDRSSEGWIVDLSGDKPVFKLESLDVGASANIILKFNVTKTGNITNIATVSADNADAVDVNDTIQSKLTREKNIKPPISAVTSDFSVEKIATNNTVALNELVYYDIIVRNDGNDILHNIVVSDLPDDGLVYVSSPDEDGWHKVEGDGLKFVLELLKPGQSSVLKVCFNATKLGTLNNNASVSSDEKNGTNSTETIEVKAYNMTVVKEIVTPAVYLGDQVIFDIVVNNTGDFDLEGIVVNDTDYDESALSLASYKSIKGSWTGANGIYSLSGALAPGETAVIRLTFDTLKAGSFNNTAVATSDKTDDVNSTNSTVVYNPDLSIEKIANNDVVHVGDEVSFTLIVKNTGDCNLTGFYVIDRNHKGLTYKGFVDDSGLWKFDGKYTWVYSGTLQPGETASFDVLFTAVSEGVKINTAIVGFGDRNMSNATNETTVVPKNSSDNETSEDDDNDNVPPGDNSGPKVVKGLSLATGNPVMVLLISLIAMFASGIYTRKR